MKRNYQYHPGSDTFKGISRWDANIAKEEGLGSLNNFYKNGVERYNAWSDKNHRTADPNREYKIPPITSVVYFTPKTKPQRWKGLYQLKYTRTTNKLNAANPDFTHYILTNDPSTVPDAVRQISGVQIISLDEFQGHPLMPHLNSLLEKSQQDPRVFVEASDVARVMMQEKYGGIYHDLDYEVFNAPTLIHYMKLFEFFSAREDERLRPDDSFLGNALIANAPDHPIIKKFISNIIRNLDALDTAPSYIKFPLNKFDSVICSTGPIAFTIATAQHMQQLEEEGRVDDNIMIIPQSILRNYRYAQQQTDREVGSIERDIGEKYTLENDDIIDTQYRSGGHSANRIGYSKDALATAVVVGGDMFSGSWDQGEEYKKDHYYHESLLTAADKKWITVPKQLSDIDHPTKMLHDAIRRGKSKEDIQNLIAAGADVHAVGKYGKPAPP